MERSKIRYLWPLLTLPWQGIFTSQGSQFFHRQNLHKGILVVLQHCCRSCNIRHKMGVSKPLRATLNTGKSLDFSLWSISLRIQDLREWMKYKGPTISLAQFGKFGKFLSNLSHLPISPKSPWQASLSFAHLHKFGSLAYLQNFVKFITFDNFAKIARSASMAGLPESN